MHTLMMSAMGGCTGLTGLGGGTRVATLCISRSGQCKSLLVITCSRAVHVCISHDLQQTMEPDSVCAVMLVLLHVASECIAMLLHPSHATTSTSLLKLCSPADPSKHDSICLTCLVVVGRFVVQKLHSVSVRQDMSLLEFFQSF